MEDALSQLNTVDYAIIAILAVWLVKGMVRGLSHELTELFIVVLAYVLSLRLYRPLTDFLMSITRLQDTPARITGYILSFIALVVLLKLVAMVLHHVMQWTFGGTTERLGGMIASGLKALIVISIVIMLIGFSHHKYLRKHFIDESTFGQVGNRHLPAMYYALATRFPILPQIENPNPDVPPRKTDRPDEPEPASRSDSETEA